MCIAARKYDNDAAFRNFKNKIYHSSLAAIFQPMVEAMLHPVVLRCPDGHYRRVIFDLAAYIADYPEQVSLAGIVSGWCPKYDLNFLYFDSRHVSLAHRWLKVLRNVERPGQS